MGEDNRDWDNLTTDQDGKTFTKQSSREKLEELLVLIIHG